jgi:uncharacterized repeat protein (TIGR01451 family)
LTAVVAVNPVGSTLDGGSPFNALDGELDDNSGPVGLDLPSGTSDDSYTGGAAEKDLCPTVADGSIPPSKADLSGVYANALKGDSHTFLYLAWERTDTNGTVTLDFELNQSGELAAGCEGVNRERTSGDRLITYDFRGGKVDKIEVRTWDGSEWGDPVNIKASGFAEGSISADLKFGELAVDLEGAGIFTPGECLSFASVFVKSRASDSFPSELKDLIAPISRTVSNCGSLTVTKTVVGGAAGDSFNFTVDCGDVDLNGNAAGTDASFSLVNGGSNTLADIPLGTSCTVTESVPGASGNWTTTYKVNSGSVQSGRSATVDIAPGTKTVAFTNTRVTGSLTITKSANAAGTFTFDIDCTADAFDRSNVSAGPGSPYVLSGIPTGTSCTVTEDDNPDFTQTQVIPDDGEVVIDSDGETVAFTNVRKTGGLTITKSANAAGTFTFDIDCSVDAFDRDDVLAGPGAPYLLSGIPTGTSCTVTENDNPDFTLTQVVPADGVVVIDTDGQTVAFTNVRKTGNLTITKSTDAPGTFTFDVDCDDDAFDQAVEITNSGSQTINSIPTGTICTVTERDNPLFSSIVIPDGGTVVIDAGGQTVAFTNTRNTGPLTVTKTAVGGTGTFTFDVDCSDNEFDQVLTIDGSGSKTILGIPTTTTCTVTERSNPLFTTVVLPGDGTVSIDAGGANVAFTNTAKPNGITLDKKVNGGDHATSGDALLAHGSDPLTYTVVITNNGLVPLTITAMSDSLYAGFAAACPQGVGSLLAPGASFTCTYQVSAGGDAHNVAAVNAVDALNRQVTDSDETFVDVIHPAISINKTADPVSVSDSGPVTYTYVVTNTGDTTLKNVLVVDDIIGAIGTTGSLAPGESVTLTKTVVVDVNTPPTNIGTATGTDVLGQTVSDNDNATITVVLGEVLALPELPRTGSPLGAMGRAGLLLLQVGLLLHLLGRRRRRLHSQLG